MQRRLTLLFITGLLAAITCTACGEDLSASVVGHWKFELQQQGYKVSTVTTYHKDGSYEDQGSITLSTGEKEERVPLMISGEWKVDDSKLIITIDKSSMPMIYHKGMVIQAKLTSVTETEMKFISEIDNKEYTSKRLKQRPKASAGS